jgi:hypothetical protein
VSGAQGELGIRYLELGAAGSGNLEIGNLEFLKIWKQEI